MALCLFPGGTALTALGQACEAGFIGCPALRYRGDCHHQDGGRLPEQVAQVLDAAGQPIAVHRTYLNRHGRKAGVEPARMTLGPVWGGATASAEARCRTAPSQNAGIQHEGRRSVPDVE